MEPLLMKTKDLIAALQGGESEFVTFEDEEGYSYFAESVRPERDPYPEHTTGCIVRLHKP